MTFGKKLCNVNESNETWSLVDLPLKEHPTRCKWVFKVKHKQQPDETIYILYI